MRERGDKRGGVLMWVLRDGNTYRRNIETQSKDILYMKWGKREEVLHMELV